MYHNRSTWIICSILISATSSNSRNVTCQVTSEACIHLFINLVHAIYVRCQWLLLPVWCKVHGRGIICEIEMRRFCARPQMEIYRSGPIGNWHNDKPQILKVDFSISYFSIPKGQMCITLLRIGRFQNFNHHYKWENVYFNNIPKPQFDHVHRSVSFWQCGSHIMVSVRLIYTAAIKKNTNLCVI